MYGNPHSRTSRAYGRTNVPTVLILFGSYVQANHEPNPKNTTAPRTLDAIYLRPTSNIQGGHELMI